MNTTCKLIELLLLLFVIVKDIAEMKTNFHLIYACVCKEYDVCPRGCDRMVGCNCIIYLKHR